MKIQMLLLVSLTLVFAGNLQKKKIEEAIRYVKSYNNSPRIYCMPVSLFPFFCSKAHPDTIRTYQFERGDTFLYKDFNLKTFRDKSKKVHLRIATVQNVINRQRTVVKKVYRYFFLVESPTTKKWIEERPPLVVSLRLQRANQYGCE